MFDEIGKIRRSALVAKLSQNVGFGAFSLTHFSRRNYTGLSPKFDTLKTARPHTAMSWLVF